MFNRRFTALLWVILIGLILIFWALFISGPNRVREAVEEQNIAKIESTYEDITGITTNTFAYKTYQGYTDTTLYWIDSNCDLITSRTIDTLDYDKAEDIALTNYDVEAQSITLGYGYDNPCYIIEGKYKLLYIDYDTFEKIYERDVT